MDKGRNFLSELKKILLIEDIYENVFMSNYTSFKVGGPVDYLVTPESIGQLQQIIFLCRQYNSNYYIIGNGTNLLVSDKGVKGVIIKLSKLNNITVKEDRVIAEAGAPLASVSFTSGKASLTGLEFASGIPGSIGGALAMNAGAYHGEMSQVVEKALVMDDEGNTISLTNDELELGYRTSVVLTKNYIVLEVTFKLAKGDYSAIKSKIDTLTRLRKEKQPLEYPSAGSTFKRPEGYFAAKLIDDCGLKGTTIGGAQVSEKHAGFIINKGDATASDILELINFVTKKVENNFNVNLHPEVRILGDD